MLLTSPLRHPFLKINSWAFATLPLPVSAFYQDFTTLVEQKLRSKGRRGTFPFLGTELSPELFDSYSFPQ